MTGLSIYWTRYGFTCFQLLIYTCVFTALRADPVVLCSFLKCSGMRQWRHLIFIGGQHNRFSYTTIKFLLASCFCWYWGSCYLTWQADKLSEFYDICKSLELARNFQFPSLAQVLPPCTSCHADCNLLYVKLYLFIFFCLNSHLKHFLQRWRIMWRMLLALWQCQRRLG